MGTRLPPFYTLPVYGKRAYCRLNTQPAKIHQALSAPGSSSALAWYGEEKVLQIVGQIAVIDSLHFRRYVYDMPCLGLVDDETIVVLDPDHAALACAVLEVRKPGNLFKYPIVERIYVHPELRRRGIASTLIASALADFHDLGLDGNLTDEGAAFFGIPTDH